MLALIVFSYTTKVPDPPRQWLHADLEQLREFLQARVADGSYVPVVLEGL